MKHYLGIIIVVWVIIIAAYTYHKIPKSLMELPKPAKPSVIPEPGQLMNCTPEHDQAIAQNALNYIGNFILSNNTVTVKRNGFVYVYQLIKTTKETNK